jgi:Co/Zn/Cd efflux system component
MLSFVMAMIALKVSLRDATSEMTFGWHRAEVIGTLASMVFLVVITVWLLITAVGRIIKPEAVDGLKMLITALVSLGFNLV